MAPGWSPNKFTRDRQVATLFAHMFRPRWAASWATCDRRCPLLACTLFSVSLKLCLLLLGNQQLISALPYTYVPARRRFWKITIGHFAIARRRPAAGRRKITIDHCQKPLAAGWRCGEQSKAMSHSSLFLSNLLLTAFGEESACENLMMTILGFPLHFPIAI